MKIDADLVIPVEYVPSEAMRMDLYRRISAAADEHAVEILREEIADRFGKSPSEVLWFLDVAKIRAMARRKGVFFIERKDGKWFLHKGRETVGFNGKLPGSSARNTQEVLQELKNVLSKLTDAITMNDS